MPPDMVGDHQQHNTGLLKIADGSAWRAMGGQGLLRRTDRTAAPRRLHQEQHMLRNQHRHDGLTLYREHPQDDQAVLWEGLAGGVHRPTILPPLLANHDRGAGRNATESAARLGRRRWRRQSRRPGWDWQVTASGHRNSVRLRPRSRSIQKHIFCWRTQEEGCRHDE